MENITVNGKTYTADFVLARAERLDGWAKMMDRNGYAERAQQARNLAASLRERVK
jgi:hypothetical protein